MALEGKRMFITEASEKPTRMGEQRGSFEEIFKLSKPK